MRRLSVGPLAVRFAAALSCGLLLAAPCPPAGAASLQSDFSRCTTPIDDPDPEGGSATRLAVRGVSCGRAGTLARWSLNHRTYDTVVSSPPAEQAAARSFTIRTSNGYVARIGAFRPSRNPLLSSAIRAFGMPSSRVLNRGTCIARWRRLRLKIFFENFGGAPPGATTCTPSVGRAQSFVARGSRFRSWNGLRPGARSSTVQERHPDAEFRQGAWWLRTAISPFGDNEEYGVVRALVGSGRVRALSGWIGGAGE